MGPLPPGITRIRFSVHVLAGSAFTGSIAFSEVQLILAGGTLDLIPDAATEIQSAESSNSGPFGWSEAVPSGHWGFDKTINTTLQVVVGDRLLIEASMEGISPNTASRRFPRLATDVYTGSGGAFLNAGGTGNRLRVEWEQQPVAIGSFHGAGAVRQYTAVADGFVTVYLGGGTSNVQGSADGESGMLKLRVVRVKR
jgi:hypothetical protein